MRVCLHVILCLVTFSVASNSKDNTLHVNPNPIDEKLWPILNSIGVPDIRGSLRHLHEEKPSLGASSECLNKLKSLVDITNITAESELFLDAAGKPSAGLTAGNLFWIGDYEMCETLSNVTREDYRSCKVTGSALIEGAPIPMTLTWTGCIPEQCQNGSLLGVLPLLGDWVNDTTKGKIMLNADKWTSDCEADLAYDVGAYAAITFLAIVGFLVVLGTTWYLLHPIILSIGQKYNCDHDSDKEVNSGEIQEEEQVLTTEPTQTESPLSNAIKCFALQRTFNSLTSTDTKPGQVLCLNGIRVLSINWVILGHTFAFVQGKLSDQSYLLDLIKRRGFTLIANAYSSVDTFFCLSGFLVSYLLLKQLTRKGHLSVRQWIAFYFHRYVRLTAPYLMILLLEGFLYRHLVSGPFSVEADITTNYETCKKYWWTNLLYINNVVPWNMTTSPCLAQSWYLANDLQFFVISPIFIVLIFLYPKIGSSVITGALACSVIATGIITSYYNLEPSMSLGNPENFVKLYRVPWVRITPYLVGILGGWCYWCWGEEVKGFFKVLPVWKKAIVALPFWVVTAVIEYMVVFGLWSDLKDRFFQGKAASKEDSISYEMLARIGWSLALTVQIFLCQCGLGGFINSLLSWKGWMVLSRLTYSVYLIHLGLICLIMTETRHSFFLEPDFEMAVFYLGVMLMSYLAAVVLCLCRATYSTAGGHYL